MYSTNVQEIKEFLKGDYTLRDGKVFFVEPPKDTELQPEEQRWTRWKKSNLAYFKEKLANEYESKIILDLGAGGAPFREILARFERVIGIDFYPYRHVALVSDLTKPLPLKSATIDIVFMSNVLEHIPTPIELLSECCRILKPGGYIVATVPFLVSIHRAPYDFHRYTNFMLERMLREAGFKEIKVEPLGSPLHVYETIQRQFFSKIPETRRARLWKKTALWIFYFFGKFLGPLPPHPAYTQGYGFYAKKL